MIQIKDIREMIKEGYPKETIENLLQQVLIFSLQVKKDYPDYKTWFLTKQIPGIFDSTRNLIIAHIKDRLVGFVSLKKTDTEKKICTFYVEKSFRKNKIGTILVEKAIAYLEEEKPLITIPMDKLGDFIKIGNHYGWKISDIKQGLYREDIPEVIVNDELRQTEKYLPIAQTYQKYRKDQFGHMIKYFFHKICGNLS